MAIKFPCRKHLVNYIGCHITGTIYSGAQIRWITFALELKNIWCILILLKHSQNQPSWCKNMWQNIWSIFTIHSGFGCEWQPSQISCFQKCKKFHVEIPNSCKTIQYVYNLEHQLPWLALIIQNDNDATFTMFDIIVQMVKVPGMLMAIKTELRAKFLDSTAVSKSKGCYHNFVNR